MGDPIFMPTDMILILFFIGLSLPAFCLYLAPPQEVISHREKRVSYIALLYIIIISIPALAVALYAILMLGNFTLDYYDFGLTGFLPSVFLVLILIKKNNNKFADYLRERTKQIRKILISTFIIWVLASLVSYPVASKWTNDWWAKEVGESN